MTDLPTGTVTFLFTDIEGSTKLWQQHPDAMSGALTRHHAILRQAIEANGGYVFQIVGDAFCAAFSTACDGLNGALAAQRALFLELGGWKLDVGKSAPTEQLVSNFQLPISNIQIRVRMALHTGVAELRAGDYTSGEYVSGLTLSRAARLLSAGHGGQVLLSDATRTLVENDLPKGATLRDLGEHRLKDLNRPEHIYQLAVPDLPTDFPPLKTLNALPNNLPIQLTSFVGREKEMTEIKRLFATTRLLTLTGAGGTGKTRLALQVGADLLETFNDGVWLIELAPLSDPSLVPQTVATALGLRAEAGFAGERAANPAMTMLTNYLQAKNLLLILDNCEHLLDACIQLTNTLLHACPTLRILASSREALGIAGEVPFRVPSLAMPPKDFRNLGDFGNLTQFEAVRLFVERAQIVKPDFAVTNHNAPALAQICYRLDGIPLAIELAASRVKVLSVEEINRRLDDRFRLLTGGSRAAMPRQQTLRALIDWGYALLSEPERALLRRLSVFAGGWTLEAAEQVCSMPKADGSEGTPPTADCLLPSDVLDLLSHLIDKSLMIAEEREGETRYRMLETIRQYAREKLLDSGEVERVRNQHLDYYVKFAEDAEPKINGAEQLIWLDKLETEHDNLRIAIEWATESGKVEAGVGITNGIFWFWYWRGYWSEGREYMLTLLARPEAGAKTAARANLLWWIAGACWLLGMFDSGNKFADEAITLARELGERQALAWALYAKGAVIASKGDMVTAEKCYEEALALFHQVGDMFGISMALNNCGTLVREQGKTRLARTSFEEAIEVDRESGNELSASWRKMNLGSLLHYQGDYAFAQALFEESLAFERKFGHKRGIALALFWLGQIATAQGDYSTARALLQESLKLRRELGEKNAIAITLDNLGTVARYEGDLATARTLVDEGLKIAHETGGKFSEAGALASSGKIALAQGDYVTAQTLFEECLAIRQQRNLKLHIPSIMQSLGDVSFLQGDDAQALAHYENGLALAKEMELKPVMAYSLRMLGYLELHAGNAPRAEELFKESFQFNAERKLKIGMIRGLPTFAALALAHGKNAHAAKLLGATEALLEPMHAHLEPVDDREYKRNATAAREQLGEDVFNAAWAESRAMILRPDSGRALEQAIEYTLEETKQ